MGFYKDGKWQPSANEITAGEYDAQGSMPAQTLCYNAEARSKLIKLAAEMAKRLNMPSDCIEDWDLPKTTPEGAKREIIKESEKAREQARLWAVAIRDVADAL